MNEITMTSYEFKNGQKSVCDKCGKYFTNKKGVKQHMLRMHSSRKVVHRINRITISEDSHDKESEEVDNEESPLFQCGECEYKTQNKETLMVHVEATHLLPKM